MKLEEYFVSDEFYNAISPLEEVLGTNDDNTNIKYIEFLISIGIRYSMVMSDGEEFTTEGLSNFLNKMATMMSIRRPSYLELNSHNDDVTDIFLDTVCDDLGIPEEARENEEVREKLNELLIRKLYGPSYIFHGYNGVTEESIREHGLDPEYSTPNQEEIDRINKIFVKYGLSAIFGWQSLNCKGKVSYSEIPDASYYYATGSPEWFSHFCGETLEYHPSMYKKHGFIRNDKEMAREDLLKLMESNGFQEEEIDEVISFFEKNWQRLANREPGLLIKRVEDRDIDGFKARMRGNDYFRDTRHLYGLLIGYGESDLQTEEAIDTSDARFIRLPKYTTVMKKVAHMNIGDEYSSGTSYSGGRER